MALEDQEVLSPEEQAVMDQMAGDDALTLDAEQIVEPTQEAAVADPPADPPADPQAKPPAMVPSGRLREEADARRAAEERYAVSERARLTLEERTNLLLRAMQQPAQPTVEAPIPDFAENPVGHLLGTLAKVQGELTTLRQGDQTRNEMAQRNSQVAAITERAKALESEFMSATPDYTNAVAHLNRVRNEELVALGFDDPIERQNIIRNDAWVIAQKALAQGANPAERIYKIASSRGYKAVTPETPRVDVPALDAATQVRTAAAGQAGARSLATVRGTAPAPLTAQRLIEMPEGEFAALLDKASPEKMREYMGGP